MNLIEAKQNIDLKVVKIKGEWRAHENLRHSGFGSHWRARRDIRHKGIGRRWREHKDIRDKGIGRGWRLQKKLENLGIREGVVIRKVSQQAFRGPVIIEIGNTRVAIGCFMAAAIKVEEIDK